MVLPSSHCLNFQRLDPQDLHLDFFIGDVELIIDHNNESVCEVGRVTYEFSISFCLLMALILVI